MAEAADRREFVRVVRRPVFFHSDMVHAGLARAVKLFPAHRAGIVELCQHIGLGILPAIHPPFLVQFAVDPWVYHPGNVEPCHLNPGFGPFREHVQVPVDPVYAVVRFGLDGWREPPLPTAGINPVREFLPVAYLFMAAFAFQVTLLYIYPFCVEPELRVAVTRLPVPPGPAVGFPLFQPFPFLHRTDQFHLSLVEDLPFFADRKPKMLFPGVCTKGMGFCRPSRLVIQLDGKGDAAVYPCLPCLQQFPCLCRGRRAEPLPVRPITNTIILFLSRGL